MPKPAVTPSHCKSVKNERQSRKSPVEAHVGKDSLYESLRNLEIWMER